MQKQDVLIAIKKKQPIPPEVIVGLGTLLVEALKDLFQSRRALKTRVSELEETVLILSQQNADLQQRVGNLEAVKGQ